MLKGIIAACGAASLLVAAAPASATVYDIEADFVSGAVLSGTLTGTGDDFFYYTLDAVLDHYTPTGYSANESDKIYFDRNAGFTSGVNQPNEDIIFTDINFDTGFDLRVYNVPSYNLSSVLISSQNFTVDSGPVTLTKEVSPAPEPSLWMLMIAGIALIGCALRVRRKRGIGSMVA